MKPTCSIVIRAYNEERHIGRLLSGILQQTVGEVEIIVVDSGSTDGTLAAVGRYPARLVQIDPREFTFGRSLNLGIAQARAGLVVIASAHVYPVYPDWLERLLAPFSDPQVALSYGKQRGAASTHFSEHQIFRQWFPEQSQPRQAHPFCNNANAAIRRSLWEQNPYNETLPGLEDLDWARWAHEQGCGIAYVAEAEIIHIHHETWERIYNRYRREGMAFKQIYPQATFGLADLLRLYLANAFNDLSAARRQGVLAANWRQILRFRWMQFLGTYHGYQSAGPLTEQLKQTFYYPRFASAQAEAPRRPLQPIRYHDLPE